MVLLFQCKYRCVKLNMLKLAPKTEQDSNGTFHQGAFLLPRWPPGHLKAHICFDRCGFFCSLLSIKKSFRIGGSQIEENENPSNSAASGAGYPVQAQAFAAQSSLQRLPVCDDVHDVLPAGLCGNRCMDQALHSYMGYAALESGAENVPTFQNVEIGGGRITGTEVTAEHPEGISFGMYHADQYVAPEGQYTTVHAVDGTAWYKQYAVDAVDKSPYMAPDGSIAFNESIVKKLPPAPRRKDKI